MTGRPPEDGEQVNCLVIVGYFTIRRGEKNVRDLVRAIMLAGPSVAVKGKDEAPVLTSYQVANGSEFVMGVQNYGRTPALLKKVYVQFSDVEPTGEIAAYEGGEEFLSDIGIYPGSEPQGFRANTFHSPYKGKHFCYGYIEYEDMFRKKHMSRFCVRIEAGTLLLESAGSQTYNEWD